MKKFMIATSLVFVFGIWAEWLIFSNPTKGVVLYMEPQAESWKLHVLTSQGTIMDIKLSPAVWQEWLQRKPIKEE